MRNMKRYRRFLLMLAMPDICMILSSLNSRPTDTIR